MVREPTDAELLSDGSPESFEAFYRRHVAAVHAYVSKRSDKADLTLDLVSETFARALRARSRFDARRGPAIAWLFGIAHNQIVDASRRGRVADRARQRLHMERIEVDESFESQIAERFDPNPLKGALASLEQSQREAIERRFLQEESYEQIAGSVGCSPQVVRKRVSRGLAAMRKAMEETS